MKRESVRVEEEQRRRRGEEERNSLRPMLLVQNEEKKRFALGRLGSSSSWTSRSTSDLRSCLDFDGESSDDAFGLTS